jgi:simple sugar transport system permease protein
VTSTLSATPDAPDAPPAADGRSARRAERTRVASVAIAVPVAAVVAALAVGALLIWREGANPLAVYGEVFRGVFVEKRGLRSTAIGATPLLLMGTGLAMAYRARLFTIGAEGQYVIGAVAATAWATAVGVRDLPGIVLIPTSIVVAGAAGMSWSAISAILAARFRTSIVISSLLLTYVALSIMQWAARVGVRDPDSFIPATRVVANAALPIVPGLNVHLGFVIALAVVPVAAVLMSRTRFGYRVDVLGHNAVALGANDIVPRRLMFTVLGLTGLLAGVAGFVEVAGVSQRINGEFSTGLGFTAIVVALLGRLHPIGVAVAALGLSGLSIGFDTAERAYDLPSSLVGVLQALIIVFVVVGDALATRAAAAES